MPHLTPAQKSDFKENGCLTIREALMPEQVKAAQDALWEGIEADRDDPDTWVEAGPSGPAPGGHPAIRATVHDSPLFALFASFHFRTDARIDRNSNFQVSETPTSRPVGMISGFSSQQRDRAFRVA